MQNIHINLFQILIKEKLILVLKRMHTTYNACNTYITMSVALELTYMRKVKIPALTQCTCLWTVSSREFSNLNFLIPDGDFHVL